MYKNHEGYADPTAGAAVKKATKAEKRNGGAVMASIYRSDIWKTKDKYWVEKTVLVLGTHDRYCSTIELTEDKPSENAVSIVSKQLMYADAGKLGYTLYGRFCSYVKNASEADIAKLEAAILNAIGIECKESEIAEIDEPEYAPCEAEAEIPANDVETAPSEAEPERKCCCAKKDLGHEIQVARLTAERDMMKALYDDAVSRLMTM